MDSYFEKQYHNVEKNHFWFKARRDYIRQLIKQFPKDVTILDIGCSSGILLDELRKDGFNEENLFGVDVSEKAIENCKKNNLPNTFVMDAHMIELNKKFDIIIASDCLEHLEYDEKALSNWYSLLNENGTAYIFVPAFMQLWSYHDTMNVHFRRYKLNELTSKMSAAQFKIKKASYWNFFLFPPVYLFRRLRANNKKDISIHKADIQKVPIGNSLLFKMISFENKILKRVNFPFGVSTFCIAKK